MEVKFADTFFESFKKMVNREKWYWKTWDFVRYDMPRFFRNIWLFRKDLYNFRWYSGHHAILPFMETAISEIAKNVDTKGHEIRTSSEKKIAKMRRAAEILNHFRHDSFIEIAEGELGEIVHLDWEFEDVPDKPGFVQLKDTESLEDKAHNSRVFARAREIEETEWKELWVILEGQDYSKFEKAPDHLNHDESYDHWQNQFDGSGMRGWWD